MLVTFFEERAKVTGLTKDHPLPPGSLEERLNHASGLLEKGRRAEMKKLERNDEKSVTRLCHLEKTGRFTEWAQAVLRDYYFDAADDPTEMTQSWDKGQCAFRHGGVEKIFVTQLTN